MEGIKKEVTYGIVVTCTTPSLLENENGIIFPKQNDIYNPIEYVPPYLKFDKKP